MKQYGKSFVMRQRPIRGLVPNTAGPLLFAGEDLPARRVGIPVSRLSYDNGFRALLKHSQKPEILNTGFMHVILFLGVQTPDQTNITQAGS